MLLRLLAEMAEDHTAVAVRIGRETQHAGLAETRLRHQRLRRRGAGCGPRGRRRTPPHGLPGHDGRRACRRPVPHQDPGRLTGRPRRKRAHLLVTDYYEILGVPRDATPEQIKKAYRRLAREAHPDVAGNDPASEERFKDVSRAYDVLGNPDKRRAYDLGGDPSAAGGMGGGFGFQDIFETFFGAATGATAQRGPIPRARRGQDALVRLDIDLSEATFGSHREVQVDTAVVCPTCQGGCCRPGTSPDVRGVRRPWFRPARRPVLPRPGDDDAALRGLPGLRHRDPRAVHRVRR